MTEQAILKSEPEITVRKFWKEEKALFCDQEVDGTCIAVTVALSGGLTEKEARKLMNRMMDCTISFYKQHGRFPKPGDGR